MRLQASKLSFTPRSFSFVLLRWGLPLSCSTLFPAGSPMDLEMTVGNWVATSWINTWVWGPREPLTDLTTTTYPAPGQTKFMCRVTGTSEKRNATICAASDTRGVGVDKVGQAWLPNLASGKNSKN